MVIADLNHRILVCTSQIDAVNGSTVELKRVTVFDAWAKVEPKKRSAFSREGYAVLDEINRVTHRITIMWRPDVDYSVAGWIYEEMLMGAPKWYKILGDVMSDDGQYTTFDVKLYQRSDVISEPQKPKTSTIFDAVPLPNGVKL